jgi:hypothetical protein
LGEPLELYRQQGEDMEESGAGEGNAASELIVWAHGGDRPQRRGVAMKAMMRGAACLLGLIVALPARAAERTLTTEERDYFARVLAPFIDATRSQVEKQQPAAQCRLEVGKRSASASSIGERGNVSQWGVVPGGRDWSFSITCGKMVVLGSISPAPWGASLKPHWKVLEEDATHRIVHMPMPPALSKLPDLVELALSAGEPIVPAVPAATAAKVSTAQLIAAGGEFDLQRFDRTPLLAALAKGRAEPLPAAPQTEPGVARQEPKAKTEADVWNALLKLRRKADPYTVHGCDGDDFAHGASIDERVRESVSTLKGQLDEAMIADFISGLKRKPKLDKSAFALGARVIVYGSTAELVPDPKTDYWKQYWKSYPNGSGNLHLSHVGVSADASMAMVYLGASSDWLAGAGNIYVFQRTGSGWQVKYTLPLWVS